MRRTFNASYERTKRRRSSSDDVTMVPRTQEGLDQVTGSTGGDVKFRRVVQTNHKNAHWTIDLSLALMYMS